MSPLEFKNMGYPTLPAGRGCLCWLQELKEETDSRGSLGSVQAQVAAGMARGKGPLLDQQRRAWAQEDLVQNLDPHL